MYRQRWFARKTCQRKSRWSWLCFCLAVALWCPVDSSCAMVQSERDRPGRRRVESDSRQVEKADGSSVEPILALDCRSVIERRRPDLTSGYFLAADMTLPPLEGGKTYRLNVTMANPYDEPIEFSTVSVSCGCAKFETKTNEIPALGSSTFVIHLDVPNQVYQGRSAQMIRFSGVDPSDQVLACRLEYEVNNVFSFAHERADVEISESEEVVVSKLPILLVPPMTLDKLEVGASENLRDVAIRLIGDDPVSAVPYVQIEVARQAIRRHGIVGDVLLRRPGTDHESRMVVSIKHQARFTLRPESLRLTRDDRSKPYEAMAMLRIQPQGEAAVDPERVADPGRSKRESD